MKYVVTITNLDLPLGTGNPEVLPETENPYVTFDRAPETMNLKSKPEVLSVLMVLYTIH